ncbi:MAG: hypothetical protein WBV69_23625, partial [Candidatus Sulfotelmatobacter sp.]
NSVGECLLGNSAMRSCAVFFMGNSFSDLEDLLIPFLDSFQSDRSVWPCGSQLREIHPLMLTTLNVNSPIRQRLIECEKN